MDLFNTISLYEWIKRLGIDKFFDQYSNFFVFLEYLYKMKYVIPFFIIKFSNSNINLKSINPKEIILNYISFNSWDNLKQKGFVQFIDQNIVSEFQFKDKKYHRIEDTGKKDINFYYYHPIQFIQILTFIYSLYKNKINLISIKEFNNYYKKRWSDLEFDVVLQSRVLGIAKKKGLVTKKEILSRIEDEYSNIQEPPFRRYIWLTLKFFNLWIKLEAIFFPKYYSPYLIPSYSIYDTNISEEEWKEIYEKEAKFREEIKNKKLNFFNTDEKKLIRNIIWSMQRIYHNFNGLDKWSDLFLEVRRSKMDNLKGIINYFMNIFSIIRTLEIANWDLKTDEEKENNLKPIFLCSAKDYPKYKQGLLIDYELVAEKIIIIYVEGETEYNILNTWLTVFRRRGHFNKIEIQNIRGKTKISNTFGYIIKNFKEKDHFLFLDADNNDKKDEKLNKLILESIPKDSVHFWLPDFVTEHFEINEVISAYKKYAKKFEIEISCEFLERLRHNLKNALENQKSFEKIISKTEYKFRDEISFPSFSKTEFSDQLSKIIIRKCKKGYKPKFEIVLDKFFDKIQEFINEYYKKKYSTIR